MSNFLSALVLANGDMLTHQMLDSHADLVRYYKIPDETAHTNRFVKVELIPVDWLSVARHRSRMSGWRWS